eukprot:551414-Hanusia_phi.AAC.1
MVDKKKKRSKSSRVSLYDENPSCRGRYGPTCKRLSNRAVLNTYPNVFNYGKYYNDKAREQD